MCLSWNHWTVGTRRQFFLFNFNILYSPQCYVFLQNVVPLLMKLAKLIDKKSGFHISLQFLQGKQGKNIFSLKVFGPLSCLCFPVTWAFVVPPLFHCPLLSIIHEKSNDLRNHKCSIDYSAFSVIMFSMDISKIYHKFNFPFGRRSLKNDLFLRLYILCFQSNNKVKVRLALFSPLNSYWNILQKK